MAPKAKPETVTATDETTLPLEAQPEAPAPVVGGADISQAEGNAPAGNPIADEPVPVMDTAPQAPADPDTLPPVPSDDEIADPVVMPDAALLRALIAAIEARNTDLHRPALWAELERAGAVVESGRLVLAGVSGAGEGQRKGMLANWTNAARRKLMEIGNA